MITHASAAVSTSCAGYGNLTSAGGAGTDAAGPLPRRVGLLRHARQPPPRGVKTATISRSGQYRRPRLHEDMIKLTDVSCRVRQIAVIKIGRDEPTLLITVT